MKIFFAKFFSFLFHPVIFFLIMPYIVVYKHTNNNFSALKWAFFSSIFIFIALILLILGRIKGVFSDFDISKREERFKFYFLVFLLAFIYFVIALFFKGVFFPLSIIVFGLIFGLIIFDVINNYLKASVHVGVICAYVTTITIVYGFIGFLFSFWLMPLVFWSRLELKKHTFQEGMAGGFLGAIITIITFLIGKYFLMK
ncbi:MAG: hypothetical protein Q8P10_00625 [bacterium]|nr:hypothetical protein [bacterium]